MRARLPFLLAFVVMLHACAARGTMATPQPITADLSAYPAVVVNVTSEVSDDVQNESAQLTQKIVEEVQKTGRFAEVRAGGVPGADVTALRLVATITDIRKINAGQRFFGGAFAGRARVRLRVWLVDTPSGRVLAEQEVTGESGGTGMSGGTADALTQGARAIARWLQATG